MPDVRSDLPTDVVIKYGTFTFGPATEIIGFKTVPVPDRSGRTFAALRHTMTVKFWLNSFDATNQSLSLDNSDNFDENLPSIRTQLMRQADSLVIQNTTFGNFTINGAAAPNTVATKDLIWGPIPRLLDSKGFYKYGAACTWEVEFCLDPCGGVVHNQIMEYNYGLSFDIDQSGYQRRTHKGIVSIPLTRAAQNNRAILGNVDKLRENIVASIPTPIGFRRESFNWELSEDKRTLTWSIVDNQMPPNIPPPGCVVAEASHSAETEAKTLVQFTHRIQASYELTTKRSRAEAWNHFITLANARKQVAKDNGMRVVPLRLEVEEPEIYGRKAASFSLTYWTIRKGQGGADANPKDPLPAKLIAGLGLWQKVPESDWNAWSKALLTDGVMTPRGTANLAWDPKTDAIVDLCLAPTPAPFKSPGIKGAAGNIRILGDEEERPDADASFVDYQLAVDVQTIDGTVQLQTLPTTPINYRPPQTEFLDVNGYQQPYPSGPCSIVQRRTMPRYLVTFTGRALRVGYAITPPQLLLILGQKPQPANDATCGFRTWLAANLGWPVVGAMWRFRYILPCPPTANFGPPSNPIYGQIGGQSPDSGDLEKGIARG